MELREHLMQLRPNEPVVVSRILDLLWWYYRRMQPDPIKERKYGDLISQLSRDNDVAPLTRWFYRTTLDLARPSDLWWKGDVGGAAREMDRLAEQQLSTPGGTKAYAYLANALLITGKIGSARQICEAQTDATRAGCLLRVAHAAVDRQLAARALAELDSRVTRSGRQHVGGGFGSAIWTMRGEDCPKTTSLCCFCRKDGSSRLPRSCNERCRESLRTAPGFMRCGVGWVCSAAEMNWHPSETGHPGFQPSKRPDG
jgi:hypothetical protein